MPTYRFADFELDTARYALSRRGVAVRLEPRVFELLAYLVANRERVVGKAELLDRLWPEQHVTEGVLTRAVHEARRALGEDARHPVHLITVHARGYRFRGDVETAAPAAGPAAAPVAAPARRRPRVLLVAAALVLLATTGAVIVARSARPSARPAAAPASVAVLPITVLEDEGELALVALSMTDLLASRLRDVPGLVVRPVGSAADAASGFDSLAEFAVAAGVAHVLSGALAPATDPARAVLTVRWTEVEGAARATTAPLGTFELPRVREGADTAAFGRARDAVVTALLARLEPALARSQPLAASPGPPSDAEAYRLYLLASSRLQANTCDGSAASDLLLQALERDPGFARAWQRLAWAYYDQVWACGADAAFYERALAAADRALALAPDELSAHNVRATVLVETGRAEEAYAGLAALTAGHPEPQFADFTLAYVLRYAGYLDEAAARIERGLEYDPLFFHTALTGEAPNALLYQGRYEDYLALLSASGSTYHRFYRGLAEYLRGREATARKVLEPAFRSNPSDVFARFARALVAVLDGDPETARSIVRQVAGQRAELDGTDGEMTYKQAQLFALAGDVEAALAELERAVEQGFFCAPCFRRDPLLVPLTDEPRFAATLAAADARHRAFGQRFGLPPSRRLPDAAAQRSLRNP